MKLSQAKKFNIKANIAICVICLAVLFFLGKMGYIRLTTPKEDIENAMVKEMEIIPQRGDLYSSDGKLLSTSVEYHKLFLDFRAQYIRNMSDVDFDSIAENLSVFLSDFFKVKTQQDYKKELVAARNVRASRYELLPKSKREINSVELNQLMSNNILKTFNRKYVVIRETEIKRIRPFGVLASRTIGNYGDNSYGLEKSCDSLLKGVNGVGNFTYVAKQRVLRKDSEYIAPVNGHDVVTTINIDLQDIAESALENQLKTHGAQAGTVVVMEVTTGKVRAIANLIRNRDDSFSESYNIAIGNYTIPGSGRMPDPGSTFKIASTIVAMEDGYITPETMIRVGNGVVDFYQRTVKDSHTPDSTSIPVWKVIETSSNVGVARFINENYSSNPQKYVDGLARLHLTEPLGIDIPGEKTPVMHTNMSTRPRIEQLHDLVRMSYGYAVSISPIQVLAFYNAIANNGTLVRPIFIDKIMDGDKVVEECKPVVIDEKICSQQTIDAVKKMLEGVVENGTARNLKNQNYQIAGKTGTAQMNYGTDARMSYHASFVGYFPVEKPEYSCIVSIYEPSEGGYYGNVVAGNVFREVADKIYSTDSKAIMKKVNYDSVASVPLCKNGNRIELDAVCDKINIPTNLSSLGSDMVIFAGAEAYINNFRPYMLPEAKVIPSVKNMGASDAVAILEKIGLNVYISGRGRVTRQSLNPGDSYSKGDCIYLELN